MNFDIAYDRLIKNEGGYVNDPDDKGGETYKGVSRKYHPNWKGWKIIDETKKTTTKSTLNKVLNSNTELDKYARAFYRANYWDSIRLDEVLNEGLKFQMFDDAVNRGVKSAIYSMQHLMGMTKTGKMSNELIYNINNYGKYIG